MKSVKETVDNLLRQAGVVITENEDLIDEKTLQVDQGCIEMNETVVWKCDRVKYSKVIRGHLKLVAASNNLKMIDNNRRNLVIVENCIFRALLKL